MAKFRHRPDIPCILAVALLMCAPVSSRATTIINCALNDSLSVSGDQVQGSTPCSFARGVAAGNTSDYYSGNVSVSPGLIKASSEIGNDAAGLPQYGIVSQGSPTSGTIVNTSAYLSDSTTVQGINPAFAYLDVTFGISFTGAYGAAVGNSGTGSIVGTFFNLSVDLATTLGGDQGFTQLGCATQFSGYSDFGSQCNGSNIPGYYSFLGGGPIATEYQITTRIANDKLFYLQMGFGTSANMFIEGGADPQAFAGNVFGHTLAWDGVLSATDPNGNPYNGTFSILSSSGFDYAQSAAAPEPSTLALGGLALASVVLLGRRRTP